MTEQEVRSDWDVALTEYEDGKLSLSSAIEWAFYPQDLMVLLCLHKAGLHRQAIIDVLEDCNFHTECGLLDEQKYDECLKVIIKDMQDWG